MSYRTYVNNEQVFGNNEYYQEWEEFITSKGIETDEEMRLGEHLEWVKDRFDTAPTIIEADKESDTDV